jgi:hypothetical protein
MIRQLGKTLIFTGAVIFLSSSITFAAEKPSTPTMAKSSDGKEMAVMASGMKAGNKTDEGLRRVNAVASALKGEAGGKRGTLTEAWILPGGRIPKLEDFNNDGFDDLFTP